MPEPGHQRTLTAAHSEEPGAPDFGMPEFSHRSIEPVCSDLVLGLVSIRLCPYLVSTAAMVECVDDGGERRNEQELPAAEHPRHPYRGDERHERAPPRGASDLVGGTWFGGRRRNWRKVGQRFAKLAVKVQPSGGGTADDGVVVARQHHNGEQRTSRMDEAPRLDEDRVETDAFIRRPVGGREITGTNLAVVGEFELKMLIRQELVVDRHAARAGLATDHDRPPTFEQHCMARLWPADQ